jgi:hypothetical protein
MKSDIDLSQQILDLHKTEIDAHLNKDVDFFVQDISEDYLAVSGGEIRKPTLEETRLKF